MLLKNFLVAITALLVLFGCSQIPNDQTNVQWQQHQQKLAKLTQFQAAGKLGFISPDEKRSMNFYWQQSDSRSQLRLTSVFGQTLLKMVSDENGTMIETFDNDTYHSENGELLLYQLTGLTIPLSQLSDWLKGSAQYADSYTLLPTNTLAGQNKTLGLQTWQINYKSYADISYANGIIPLPNSLSLTQDQTKINLRITNWTIK